MPSEHLLSLWYSHDHNMTIVHNKQVIIILNYNSHNCHLYCDNNRSLICITQKLYEMLHSVTKHLKINVLCYILHHPRNSLLNWLFAKTVPIHTSHLVSKNHPPTPCSFTVTKHLKSMSFVTYCIILGTGSWIHFLLKLYLYIQVIWFQKISPLHLALYLFKAYKKTVLWLKRLVLQSNISCNNLLERFPMDLRPESSADVSRWFLTSRGSFFLTLLRASSPRCEPHGVQYECGMNPSCLLSAMTYTQSFSRYSTFTTCVSNNLTITTLKV